MSDLALTRSDLLKTGEHNEHKVDPDVKSLAVEAFDWMKQHKTELAVGAAVAAAAVGGLILCNKLMNNAAAQAANETGVGANYIGKYSAEFSLPQMARLSDYTAVAAFSSLPQTDHMALSAAGSLGFVGRVGANKLDGSMARGVVEGSVAYVQGRTGNAYTSFLLDRFGKYSF